MGVVGAVGMGRLRARKSFFQKTLEVRGRAFLAGFGGALGVVERPAVGVRRGADDAQHRAGERNETRVVGEGGEEAWSGWRGDGDWAAAMGVAAGS